jgi:hypothetical protein
MIKIETKANKVVMWTLLSWSLYQVFLVSFWIGILIGELIK